MPVGNLSLTHFLKQANSHQLIIGWISHRRESKLSNNCSFSSFILTFFFCHKPLGSKYLFSNHPNTKLTQQQTLTGPIVKICSNHTISFHDPFEGKRSAKHTPILRIPWLGKWAPLQLRAKETGILLFKSHEVHTHTEGGSAGKLVLIRGTTNGTEESEDVWSLLCLDCRQALRWIMKHADPSCPPESSRNSTVVYSLRGTLTIHYLFSTCFTERGVLYIFLRQYVPIFTSFPPMCSGQGWL